ncbi:MAG: hypothetical protein AAFN77_08835 [Planctomycetota bacterium]
MKSIVTTLLVAFFLFAASAGASWWYLHEPIETTEEMDELIPPDMQAPKGELVEDGDQQEAMPVAIRPDLPISAEVATELAKSMMEKERAMFEKEQRIKRDERRIEMLFEDLKREQEKLMAFHSKVEAKIVEAKEAVSYLKLEQQSLQTKIDELTTLQRNGGTKAKQAKDAEIADKAKDVARWLRSVDDDQAATVLKELANKGEIEFVGMIIDELDDRKKADVLTAFNNTPLVAEIISTVNKSPSKSNNKLR